MPTEISHRPITKAQIKAIHVALSYHRIPDREYRERLHTDYGAKSCKDLTRRQASELLRRLGVPLKRPPGTQAPRTPRPRQPRTRAAPGVTWLPSVPQRQLIDALAREIDWRVPNGHTLWLKRNMGLARISTADQAARVIEGLKAIKRRGGE